MAKEGISVQISPEIVMPDEVCSRSSEGKSIASKSRTTKQPDPRRASTGSLNNGGRKFSSGKPSSLNSGGNPVPHYLRASTGSCHDLCKYGRKHETEEKPWQTKARKVKKPTLNQQNDSKTGELSEKNITKLVSSKPPPVSKSNSPSSSAVFRNKTSFKSNELAIPSWPVSGKEDKAVNEKKKKNVIEKQNTPVLSGRRESDSGLAILPRLVSAKEKKKNIIEKGNTPVLTGRREIEIKPDKTKETSKDLPRKLVSTPVAYLATKPSFNVVFSSKGDTNRSKKSVTNLKDQNKIKAEHKHSTNNTLKVKTEHAIKVEDKEIVAKVKEKNQEGIEEVENMLIENEKDSDETLSVMVVSENIVPELKQSENTIDIPLSELFSSPSISSQGKTPDLSDGEVEAQIEPENNKIENKGPESEQNECTSDSPRPKSSSSRGISSPLKSLTLSGDGLELNTSDAKKNESTMDIPLSEPLSSMNILSPVKSPASSYCEEEAQFESEYINNESTFVSLPSPNSSSQVKSPASSSCDEESQFELEYSNIEKKVPEFEQNESTFDSLPSPKGSSQVKSPALSCGEEEAQDELEYLDTETDSSDDSISESSEILNSDTEETSVGNFNIETRKAKVASEENDVATKLKFKRGKVVEIKSNNSAPRRLRFRRGRVLDENQDKNVGNRRRSFTKGGVDGDIDDANDDSEKVVLRHQEVEGKKDAQGLFNNVIEETASKLVETRKSKVKALVGAFETVISLQEVKPSTQSAFVEK